MVKDAPLTKKSGLLRRGGCDAESESSESRPRLPSRQRDEISEPSLNTAFINKVNGKLGRRPPAANSTANHDEEREYI